MARTAIISVDGHVKASRAMYREYIEPKHRDVYDEWVRAAEASGMRDAGNMQPDLPLDAQWDAARRVHDPEGLDKLLRREALKTRRRRRMLRSFRGQPGGLPLPV